jgi:hypothetical protein
LAGEYREQIKLKTGVTLRSRLPREAVLRAAPLANGAAVFADGVKDARVTGLRIVADEQMPLPVAIKLLNSDVEVDDVEIDHAGIGMEIHGGAALLVGNAVHDSGAEGILMLGGAGHWLSHNSLQRNKGAGVAARDGAKAALVGNIFEKNSLELPGADTNLADTNLIRERNFFLDAPARATPPRGRK